MQYMNIIEFASKFPDEASCKVFFKEYREKQGLQCRKCGGSTFHWLKTHDRWQCKDCMAQIGLRSGTLLESSKLPYRYWIWAIYLMANNKKGISAQEMQRQLGHKRYEPIWAMMHKIRAAMGNRDAGYLLDGQVEFDDGFVRTNKEHSPDLTYGDRRGRGSQKNSSIGMISSTGPGKPGGKKNSALKYVRLTAIPDQTSKSMESVVEKEVSPQATLITDGFRSFSKLGAYVVEHKMQKIPASKADTVLPWVHTMISNFKRTMLGINHSIKETYLQNYLNEFCYRVNRRYFKEQLFDRLMTTAVAEPWYGQSKYYANG
jgi:hypothetical protein